MDSPANCPSGELIYRYIKTLCRNTQTNIRGKSAPNLSTIECLWVYAIEYLKFTYRDLKDNYGAFEIKRIETMLDQQVSAGKLYKGIWFKRQWLGFVMIQRLTSTFVKEALQSGCASWDKVINSPWRDPSMCMCLQIGGRGS